MKRVFMWWIALVLIVACHVSVAQAEWGHLKGRFVYDGEAPAPRYFDTGGQDKAVCGDKVLNESLLVDVKTGGVSNILVYLRTQDVAVHPDYAATDKSAVRLITQNCKFRPHLTLVRVSQPLVFDNRDAVGYAPKFSPVGNQANNVLLLPNHRSEYQFGKPLTLPTDVACSIHPWMKGYLFCRDNPYMTATAQDGSFEIKNLPAGEHEFQFWHEQTGYLARDGWAKGRVKIVVRAGETVDLGEVKLEPKLFGQR